LAILVTGATGFVGSAVVRHLLEAGHEVRVLVRPHSNQANIGELPVEVCTGDLADPASLSQAVSGCEGVFHVAADYRLWALRPRELYDTNVGGSLNVLRAAADAGVARIVYTSSVAVLGLHADGTPSDESTIASLADMVGHYKRSKFLAEHKILDLARRERLPVVVVNPSTPMGPRDIKPTPTGRVIVRAAAGKMPAYVNTGLNLVHVDDVAQGHLLAYRKGVIAERYILGGEDWTLHDILRDVAALTHRNAPRLELPHQAVMPVAYVSQAWARITRSRREPMVCVDAVRMSKKRMFFSSDKARRCLGYNPRPAREALRDAVEWFTDHGYC